MRSIFVLVKYGWNFSRRSVAIAVLPAKVRCMGQELSLWTLPALFSIFKAVGGWLSLSGIVKRENCIARQGLVSGKREKKPGI